MSNEQDVRLGILNTLLTTPHRKLDEIQAVHAPMIKSDPLFYGHLAAWYNKTGEIRDHKEVFTVNLCLSDFEGHRDAGLAILREMPPHQVARVVNFIHGNPEVKAIPVVTATETKDAKKKKTRKLANKDSVGLRRNIPRSMRTEIERYLREREGDNKWFDSSVTQARKDIKRLYALLHIKPGERAQKIIFDEEPPEDSTAAQIKELSKQTSPAEQAKVIIEHKIPYRVASTVVTAMTPTVLLALVQVMSSQELINNIDSLQRRGAFENEEIKALIDQKLAKAKGDKKVAALKSMKVTNVDAATKKALEDIADTQIKSKGRIKLSTCLMVDKSGSMTQAIELGKQIGSILSAVMDAPLYVYAFDNIAYPLKPSGTDLASWEKAFKGISSGGGTACGVAFDYLIKNKQLVEQVILITDEGDNQAPLFYEGFQKYVKAMGNVPAVTIVKTVGASDKVERDCRNAKIAFDTWQFAGGTDYYSLPEMVKMLSRPSKLDLLMEIMSTELPERRAS